MFLLSPTTQSLIDVVCSLNVGPGEAACILAAEHSVVDWDHLIKGLNQRDVPFFGGLFPGVLCQNQQYQDGAIAMKLPVLTKPFLIRHLNDQSYELPDFLSVLPEPNMRPTAMVFVDGLTGNLASFMMQMYNHLANRVSYFGGGAGSLSLTQKPCLICNEGFFQDAALVVLLHRQATLGVRHGWQTIMGPFVATKTDNTRIIELNWQPAFDVYRSTVEGDTNQKLDRHNFFSIAKGYPFGMKKDYAECIVRDPIAVGEQGELVCVGEVPENSILEILKGDSECLIAAAELAAADCQGAKERTISHGLVIDCISRVLFLEEKFTDELDAVQNTLQLIKPELTNYGVLTLGEISSYGDGFLEFFNKTIVVGVLHD